MSADTIAAPWSRELDTWRGIPAESSLWDDIDGFVAALRDLARQKCAERETGRTALREALAALLDGYRDDLDYFEARIATWHAEAVSWNDAMSVAEQVDGLRDELQARRELQSTRTAHYTESRRVQQQVMAAEDAIFNHLSALDGLFSGGTGESQPAPANIPAEPRAVVEERRVTPADSGAIPLAGHAVGTPDGAAAPTAAAPARQASEDALHRPLDADGAKWSPLTRSQEQEIEAAGPGVGVVFASSALGFEHLPASAMSLLAGTGGVAGMVPPGAATESEIEESLARLIEDNAQAKRVLAFQPVPLPTTDVADRVRIVSRLALERSAGRAVQVLLFLAPGGGWAWSMLPDSAREDLAATLKPVLALHPWDRAAVQERLARTGKAHDDATCDAIVEATGGWSWLLDQVLTRSGRESDPRPAAAQVRAALKQGGDLRGDFELRMGVQPGSVPRRVLDLLVAEREVPLDLVEPGMLAEETTAEECAAAIRFLQAVSCATVADGALRIDPFLASVLGD